MAAKMGTVGEYVYLWDKLLYSVVLDSLCEAVGWGPVLGVAVLSVLALLSQYSELDENKLDVRLFDNNSLLCLHIW